jgi:hypothetical protein
VEVAAIVWVGATTTGWGVSVNVGVKVDVAGGRVEVAEGEGVEVALGVIVSVSVGGTSAISVAVRDGTSVISFAVGVVSAMAAGLMVAVRLVPGLFPPQFCPIRSNPPRRSTISTPPPLIINHQGRGPARPDSRVVSEGGGAKTVEPSFWAIAVEVSVIGSTW